MIYLLQRIKVSAGLQLATLRYNSALPEHSWLRQIMDMFNVEVSHIQIDHQQLHGVYRHF